MAEEPELDINYLDIGRGSTHKAPVGYVNLSQFVRDRIDAADLTEHELLDKINLALGRIIAHLEEITDEVFTEEDVMEWL